MIGLKINPLNVLDIREVDVPPEYFTYIFIDLKHQTIKQIRNWIIANLKHRFYFKEALDLDQNNQFQIRLKIGFEESKEASFFLIACPYLKSVSS